MRSSVKGSSSFYKIVMMVVVMMIVMKNDLIGIFSVWAIQIYMLVTQENKNSILDIII